MCYTGKSTSSSSAYTLPVSEKRQVTCSRQELNQQELIKSTPNTPLLCFMEAYMKHLHHHIYGDYSHQRHSRVRKSATPSKKTLFTPWCEASAVSSTILRIEYADRDCAHHFSLVRHCGTQPLDLIPPRRYMIGVGLA